MYNVFQLAYSTETLKKIPLKIKHQRIFFKIRPLKILKKNKYQKNSIYATFKFFLVFEHSVLPKLLIRFIQKMGGKNTHYAGKQFTKIKTMIH